MVRPDTFGIIRENQNPKKKIRVDKHEDQDLKTVTNHRFMFIGEHPMAINPSIAKQSFRTTKMIYFSAGLLKLSFSQHTVWEEQLVPLTPTPYERYQISQWKQRDDNMAS